MKADNPKHLDIRKCEAKAPKEPQLFWKALFELRISPGLRSSTRLWSCCPVEKNEMKAIIMYIDSKINTMPAMKFIISFWKIFLNPTTSLNVLFVFDFFFLAISVFGEFYLQK